MKTEIGDEIHLGATVSPFDNVGGSSAIDKIASNYNDAKEKVHVTSSPPQVLWDTL